MPKPNEYETQTTRAVTLNGKNYCELIYSEKEVQAVASILKKIIFRPKRFIMAMLQKLIFFKKVVGHQYVLVSAHGIRNDRQPELSGIIFSPKYYLAPFLRFSFSRNDGFQLIAS